jgi:hypothetical protein
MKADGNCVQSDRVQSGRFFNFHVSTSGRADSLLSSFRHSRTISKGSIDGYDNVESNDSKSFLFSIGNSLILV